MRLPAHKRIAEAGAWVLDRHGVRTSARRRRWLSRSAAMTPAVVTDMQGAKILVRTNDPFVSASVFADGRYGDAIELDAAVRTLRAEGFDARIGGWGTFLDIGANIGTATVSALTRQAFSNAVAIEPEPENLAMLRANIALNALHDRVRVVAAAVGAEDGAVELVVNRENPGDHRVVTGSSNAGSAHSVTVPLRSLDSMVAADEIVPSDIGLLWIDVQGLEAEVLRGASTLIDVGVPAVVEYSPEHMASGPTELRDLIEERFARIGDLREARSGSGVTLRPASDIAKLRPAGRFTDLLLLPRSGR